MKVGTRYLALSGKLKSKFVIIDSIEPTGEIIICSGGEWDRVGECELCPVDTETEKGE